MFAAAFLQRLLKFPQQFALMLGEFHWCFDQNVAIQVTRVTRAHPLDAFAAQPELLAGLSAFRDVNGRFSGQRGYVNFPAKCGGDDADRHRAMQIVAVTFENVVLFEPDFNVEVTGRAAVGAGLAVACAANAHAAVNAGRDLDLKGLLLLDLALAVACGAGLWNDLARAAAGGAGLLHTEKALAHLHRPRPAAGAAGFGLGTGLGTAAVAHIAVVPTGNANLGVFSFGSFLQGDLHGVAQVAAAKHLSSTTGSSTALLTKHVAKNVTKGFSKTTISFSATRAAAHVGIDPSKAMLVVGRALLRVRQHLVGFLGFLELFFRAFGCIPLVAVRVVLHRMFAISLLDFFIRRVFGDAQNFVVISFCHGL